MELFISRLTKQSLIGLNGEEGGVGVGEEVAVWINGEKQNHFCPTHKMDTRALKWAINKHTVTGLWEDLRVKDKYCSLAAG